MHAMYTSLNISPFLEMTLFLKDNTNTSHLFTCNKVSAALHTHVYTLHYYARLLSELRPSSKVCGPNLEWAP